jgi:hypothetical protein
MAAEPIPPQSDHEANLAAYRLRQQELEAEHRGDYVAITGGCIIGVYPSFDEAQAAVTQHQRVLVFEIGTEPILSPLRAISGRKLGNIGR